MTAQHQGGRGVLYLLSMEDAHRPLFMKCLPAVYRQLIGAPDLRAAPELLALAINLTHDKRLAEVAILAECCLQCTEHALTLFAGVKRMAFPVSRSSAAAGSVWSGSCRRLSQRETPWRSS